MFGSESQGLGAKDLSLMVSVIKVLVPLLLLC